MRSLIKKSIVWLCVAGLGCCGGSEEEGPGRQACAIDAEVINEGLVDLKIDFELPAALSSNCDKGEQADLQAYVLIPAAETCDLTLSSSVLTGCCPDIVNTSNQMLSLTLVYRDLVSKTALAEQIKNQFLKTTSPRTVEVNFANEEVDTSYYDDNLSQWCSGML